MSVVNQMLRELDRRRASAAERGSLPRHLSMLPQPSRSLPGRTLMLAVAALSVFLGIGGGFAWEQSRRDASTAADRTLAMPAQRPLPEVAARVREASSAPDAGDMRHDSIADARTTRAESVVPPTPASLEPQLRQATTLSMVALARRTPVAAPDLPAPSQAKSAPVAPPPPLPKASTARPASAVTEQEAAEPAEMHIEKKVHPVSARERAEGEFRRANAALAQGSAVEALTLLRQALHEDPTHVGARLALARLAAESGDDADAADVLRAGAASGAANAEYHGLYAAVLQRLKRHADAVGEYQAALRLMPGNGVWWMGLGLSLEAAGNGGEAHQAYLQARSAGTLSTELAAFVEQKLRHAP